ncbi:DEKNAAC104972 [Brettanomyces naardenensis]|uniref:Vacuolar membrane-associated protein IML1 n=1 Tax=Brettanomyces naardenensis TaxID=13370 RepID=A0A448YRV5_BRENA|nr:DEKNAAC104972 [Brettanomyces naardenensis]
MWHFEESGQQMFYKLVNSLFPKVFKRWKELGTHHLITIVLFTSVDLDEEGQMKYAAGERPPNKQDYYRVVVDQVSILLWNEIMATLRLEFANFKRDILLGKNRDVTPEHPQQYQINGQFLPAVKGNLLEAINLGMSLVSNDFRDQDLRQTTNHFIIVTPGTGLFDVDYNMLVQTGKMLATVDSTIDVICLSQPPLHVVPLFRYLDNQHKPHHCIPNFMDISFWSDSTQSVHQWLPRCKIYELQMMGVMENELTSINVNELNLGGFHSCIDAMNDYDGIVFRGPLDQRRRRGERRRTTRARLVSGAGSSFAISASSFGAKVPSTPLAALSSTTVSIPTSIPRRATSTEQFHSATPEAKGFQPSELAPVKASTATTSNATGVTTTSKSNVSAFSSLLSISKTNVGKMAMPNAFNFVKRIISSPMLTPLSPNLAATAGGSSTILEESGIESVKSLTLSATKGYPFSPIHDELKGSAESLTLPVGSPRSRTGSLAPSTSRRTPINRMRRLQKSNPWDSYWTTVENPSNVMASEFLGLVSYGRWQFVFPANVRRRIIKWASLASPAALPVMTPFFPSCEDFNQNFTFRIYDVLLNPSGVNENRTSESLMRSMISLRISLGFQICVGDDVRKVEEQRKPNGDSRQLIQYLDRDHYQGSRIYLSLSDEIHRISCDYNGLVNVQVYRKITRGDGLQMNPPVGDYVENIRTRYSTVYHAVTIHQSEGELRNYNWNQLDQVLAGYDDSVDAQTKYHRLKFVILPMRVAENSFKLASEKLSPEEIRLEGIRSLVATINKNRYRTPEEKKLRRKKTEITPEITFYTGNLYKFLENQASLELMTGNTTMAQSQLFSAPTFSKSISLSRLAGVLQSDEGIEIADRKWHMVTHYHCFVGTDFVSWLIENFEDIDNREEAVDYGNQMMDRGLFKHVNSRHHFLDGHYFYEIRKEYLKKEDDSPTGVSSMKQRLMPLSPAPSYASTPPDSPSLVKKRKVMLSRKVLYDLDPNHVSWQQELVNVHYDIVHNPEHCFHVRLEWLNTTSKLIEDTISSWEKHCERYGLELVEIPWEELCTLPLTNPLHSTIDIELVLDPWKDPEFAKYHNILSKNKYFYHLYLLEKCEFMLDNRTATFFSDDGLDVFYSWGRPKFKYAQFIHSTGAYIAELRQDGDFFLAPNNMHIARVNLSIGQLQGANKGTVYFDSQSVMLDFRSICTDKVKLRDIFREAITRYDESRDVELALFEDEEREDDF